LFATPMRWKSGGRLLSLALLGGIALSVGGGVGGAATVAAASPSDTHASVVFPDAVAFAAVQPITPGAGQQSQTTRRGSGGYTGSSGSWGGSATWNAWTPVPGHPSYALSDFAGDPYSSVYGQCVWYAWYKHRYLPLLKMGNAGSWPARARSLGLRVSTWARTGATIIFMPGVQGASPVGHAGVVEAILSGGWLVISEMNFSWNGGGWGRVNYRYVHTGSGVYFIS
jgi:surface antigen